MGGLEQLAYENGRIHIADPLFEGICARLDVSRSYDRKMLRFVITLVFWLILRINTRSRTEWNTRLKF